MRLYYGRITNQGKGRQIEKIYAIDPVTSPVVRRIYEDFAKGKPLQEIIDDLNIQGLKTAKGGLFNVNGLRNILMNRMYLGEYHYGDVIVSDGVPRIISDDLFKDVQKRFVLNKHKPKSPEARHLEATEQLFWLTGNLFCGECKESMQRVSGTSKSGRIHYYYGIKHYFEMYAKADFEDDETRRMIFEYFIDKIYVFEDKLIVDMFYSDNYVEVSLDAFLASEEYAKESIKDLKI